MNHKGKCSLFWTLFLAAIFFYGCGNTGSKVDQGSAQDSIEVCRIDTVPVQNEPDRTLYGRGADFGMSTFSLVAEDDKKYEVTRVSENGNEGRIYGSVAPGNRYALMMDQSGEALECLINLDELELFVDKNYYIYNGELVLTLDGNREWVDVERLSASEFVAAGRGGTHFSYTK